MSNKQTNKYAMKQLYYSTVDRTDMGGTTEEAIHGIYIKFTTCIVRMTSQQGPFGKRAPQYFITAARSNR